MPSRIISIPMVGANALARKYTGLPLTIPISYRVRLFSPSNWLPAGELDAVTFQHSVWLLILPMNPLSMFLAPFPVIKQKHASKMAACFDLWYSKASVQRIRLTPAYLL